MGLLRDPAFRRLWAAQTVTQCGTQFSILALPLTALEVLDASAFEVSALQAVQVAPYLLIGLPAGAWVDRMRRKPVLVLSDVVRAVALLTVPLAYALGALTLGQLYAVGLVIGTATVFFDVAYQSYLPDIIAAEDLAEGNAKLEVARSGSRVAGPALGGWLIGLLRGPGALCLDAFSFLYSAVMVWRIPATVPAAPTVPSAPAAEARPPHALRREIGEGLRFVRRHRLLAPIAATAALLNLSYAMASALLVTYASRELGFSAGRIGLVMGLASAGLVAGALAARHAARRLGAGASIVAGALLAGAGPCLLPLSGYAAPETLLACGLFVQSFGVVLFNVNQVSMRQAVTPRPLMGRMNATVRFVTWGALPLGALCGGALAGVAGIHTALWISALAGVPAFLAVALSDVRRAGADGMRTRPRATVTSGKFTATGRDDNRP